MATTAMATGRTQLANRLRSALLPKLSTDEREQDQRDQRMADQSAAQKKLS